MKIEKISETQMKFVLMTDDLAERDIKINELSYGSDKTQQLFREIMHLVQDESEFVAEENTPLMFEAIRVGVDSLVVMVTKMNESAVHGMEGEPRLNLIPAARQECRFKKGGLIKQPEHKNEDSFAIFSFDDIDIMAAGASRLPAHFSGISQAHKLDGKYFLMLKNETEDNQTTGELETILFEYGQKHISNAMSRQYLIERGEMVISEDAVEKLRLYHAAQ